MIKKKFRLNKTLQKQIILLIIMLFTNVLCINAQTFVATYSEDFESKTVGTQISNLDFSWWGFNSTVTESSGNGALGSNRFVSTSNTQNTVGINKKFSLVNGKQYRFNTYVKTASTNIHNPLRITRPNGTSYINNGQISGTNNWEVYSANFTALATEVVDFVTVKVNSGELSYDNIKLQIQGIAWTGSISTNWHDAGNWEGNQVPTEDDSVLIVNTTNQPIISDAEVRIINLEIADGTKLLVQNNKPLIVNGQLTGNTGYVELLSGSTLFADRIVGENHIISEAGFFTVNSVFQSNMVLQRQQPIPIYGTASNGLTISVTLDGVTKTTTSNNEKWEVIFDAKEAGGGALNLSVTGTETFNFSNILIGDVWICGGQSNMQLTVGNFKDSGYSEFANVPGTYENNLIRFATASIYESNEKQDNIQYASNWQDANSTSILQFSATGYFFGKYLHQEVNVPIGLITVARGGTGMGSFIPLETVNANPNIKDKYDYEAISLSGPSTLYNTMVHPLTKQPIKGVVWYQGEHEANRLADRTTFSSIFTDLINSWRTAWNQNDMPFIFTQLSAWAKQNSSTPVESSIAIVRNQQLKTWKTLANTGMVVSIDGGVNGGSDDIHPPNKEDVGSRLALFARKLAYGEDITYTGPQIREITRINGTNRAIVKFKHYEQGLEAKAITLNTNGSEQFTLNKDILYGFEIAGSDNIFHNAVALIKNDSIVTVTSDNVLEPMKVRFGWNNFPLTNLFNDTNLPASPFEEEVTLVNTDNSLSKLVTYNDIPGRNPSNQYSCRVKFVNEPETAWRDVFVLQTTAKDDGDGVQGNYFDNLEGWSASWITFESDFNDSNVIVEISKTGGSITKAMVRPVGEAQAATISNGKAYVTFSKTANVNVDINGQLEDTYTGYGYQGNDIHTISIFANPIFEIPDTSDPNVRVLQTNEDINTLNRDDWQTIIFAPGVHDIGMEFQIRDNETLFIPGDAVVHGTIHPIPAFLDAASQFFKVYGSGTISGENITREITTSFVNGETVYTRSLDRKYKPFTNQAEGAHLEGFVVADPAFHTFNMGHSRGGTTNPNIYKNLKIFAWRVNSDGINAFRNSIVTDCFFRVQDDAFYLGQENVVQKNNTVWNDANGAVLFLQNITDGSTNTFSDVKVIYHRASWHWWNGGRIVSMRELKPGSILSNIYIKNILVEDPLPAFPPFFGRIQDVENDNRGVTLNNIVIENVRQEHDGVSSILDATRGKPKNMLRGLDQNRKFENILFKNNYFNGKTMTSFEEGNFIEDIEFKTEFVDTTTVVFSASQNQLKVFDGDTNLDWNTATNWDDDTLPTSINDVLIPTNKNVTIPANAKLEINDLVINTNSSLTIADKGSLIVKGIAPYNDVTYQKTLHSTNWHLLSSPTSGLVFNDDFVSAYNIASGQLNSSNRGIATYNTLNNSWTYLQAANSLPSTPGVGYMIKQAIAGNIDFKGTINTENVSVTVSNSGNGFNLLGNPFTSYLNSATFLQDNSDNLVSQTIWIWNPVTNTYETKVTGSDYILEPGQGFFVKSSNGSNLSILETYQTANVNSSKSENIKITLSTSNGELNRFANIYYLANATKGFDNGYDGEVFSGQKNNFEIYTELLENNDHKKYQIQSLPNSDFENMVIPVGITSESNKEITLTAEVQNLPSELKVYLEDRTNNTFTRLDENGSSFRFIALGNEIGRFYLHTKSAVLNTDEITLENITVYQTAKNALRINGINSDNISVKIYDILGKNIVDKKYPSKGIFDVTLPNITPGVYVIQLQTEKAKSTKKIMID